jgi:hypothetical protein
MICHGVLLILLWSRSPGNLDPRPVTKDLGVECGCYAHASLAISWSTRRWFGGQSVDLPLRQKLASGRRSEEMAMKNGKRGEGYTLLSLICLKIQQIRPMYGALRGG